MICICSCDACVTVEHLNGNIRDAGVATTSIGVLGGVSVAAAAARGV
jgi:hypothetical protein